jgi:hypothetical protein
MWYHSWKSTYFRKSICEGKEVGRMPPSPEFKPQYCQKKKEVELLLVMSLERTYLNNCNVTIEYLAKRNWYNCVTVGRSLSGNYKGTKASRNNSII